MMKMRVRALLLCLVMMSAMVLTACGKSGMDIVVGQVGAETITAREVTMYANYMLLNSGYSRADMAAEDIKGLNANALDYAVTNKVIRQKAAALGLYPLSADNQKKAEDSYNEFVAYIESSSGLASTGLNQDDIRVLMTLFVVSDALMAETTKDVAVTDDEIQTEYNTLLTAQQSSYSADAGAYDTARADGSTVVVYRPAGYRYVKHILIAMPDEISTQITAATSSGEADTVAALRKQGLDAIQEKADAALERVKNGEDFDKLIAELGADPGMQAEPAKTQGYELGAASSFVPEFLEAAMGLKSAGETTGLVATDYGYHIIRYIGDAPEGPMALSDVKDGIAAGLLAGKRSTAYNALVEQWKKETAVKRNIAKMPG